MNFDYKSLIFSVSLLYLSLFVPLSITLYSQTWYEFNFNLDNVDDYLGEEKSSYAAENLIGFYLYKNEIDTRLFLEQEKKHFEDVRDILRWLFGFGILAFLGLGFYNKEKVKGVAFRNIVILTFLGVLIFVNFKYFWSSIFHTVLFDNLLWINGPNTLSFYLFPMELFFVRSGLLALTGGLLINLVTISIIKWKQ